MKTRIRTLDNGAQEVIRLLSADELEAWTKDDPLAYEKSIVWLEDVSQLRYVRVKTVGAANSRRGPLYLDGDGRVVGYSKLTPDAPRNSQATGYRRRIFYLQPRDYAGRETPIPHGAIDPRTILPGVAGQPVDPALSE
jgi:hypothetical protein